jgi:hypothetical protein
MGSNLEYLQILVQAFLITNFIFYFLAACLAGRQAKSNKNCPADVAG